MPTTLSISDIKVAILAGWNSYIDNKTGNLKVRASDRDVEVTIKAQGSNYACEMPGINMVNADVKALKDWVSDSLINPKGGGNAVLSECENVGGTGQVTVNFQGPRKFTFHINLVNPC